MTILLIAHAYMSHEFVLLPFPDVSMKFSETLTNKFQTMFIVKACFHFIETYEL